MYTNNMVFLCYYIKLINYNNEYNYKVLLLMYKLYRHYYYYLFFIDFYNL